jgi:hypothetical protein
VCGQVDTPAYLRARENSHNTHSIWGRMGTEISFALLGIRPWFLVCPARGAVTEQFLRGLRYLLWASQVQTLLSVERRRCRTGTALTIAVGRQLASTRTICDCRSPRLNFTFTSRTSFTAGAQNQWNTYSFPVSTSYLRCYRMKKKTHIFPLRPAIRVRVVPCCVTRSWCGVVEFCSVSLL